MDLTIRLKPPGRCLICPVCGLVWWSTIGHLCRVALAADVQAQVERAWKDLSMTAVCGVCGKVYWKANGHSDCPGPRASTPWADPDHDVRADLVAAWIYPAAP